MSGFVKNFKAAHFLGGGGISGAFKGFRGLHFIGESVNKSLGLFQDAKTPDTPADVAVPDLASAQKAADEKLKRGKLGQLIGGGRRNPILTSPTGVDDGASIGTKKLLGQ
jgi:hypothetical protein